VGLKEHRPQGVDVYFDVVLTRINLKARMEGMVVFDYAARYPEGVQRLGAWLRAGAIKSRDHVVEGLDDFPPPPDDAIRREEIRETGGEGRRRQALINRTPPEPFHPLPL